MTTELQERPRPQVATDVDTEEIKSTRSEKLLAWVMVGFLLVGGGWFYDKLSDIPSKPDGNAFAYYPPSREDRAAMNRSDRAETRLSQAQGRLERAQTQLEIRREAYRTALDAGRPAAALEASYQRAQRTYSLATKRVQSAQTEVVKARPAAKAAEKRSSARSARQGREFRDQQRAHDRNTFLLRLGYVLSVAAFAYWLLGRVRRRRPRYLPIAIALVGFAVIQALYLAGDYTYDYVEFSELGPLTISLAGIAMTFAAFIALQRYVVRRTPLRRVRKRECPFCGFPVADNDTCEGCGRATFADCATCNNRRRVGTRYCGVCGSA